MPTGGQIPAGFNGTWQGPATFGGVVTITNTTASGLPTTGALVVAGGLGVSGQIRCASSAVLNGGCATLTTFNPSSTNNARLNLADLGPLISRNIADANPALIVDLVNAGSTGKIVEFRSQSTAKASIDLNGNSIGPVFTVAGLPAGSKGMRSMVTDALAPAFAAVVAGGGAVTVPVYHDGTNWRVG